MLDQDVVNLLHYLKWQGRFSSAEIAKYFRKPIHKVFFCHRDTTPEYDAKPYLDKNELPQQLRQFIEDVDGQLKNPPSIEFMFGFPISEKQPRLPTDRRDAFIAMPYGELWSNDVEKTILAVGTKHKFNCVVSKHLRKPGSIIEQVWQDIRKSEVLVADLTSRNPNVYYELGLAQALGKACILLLQKEEQIPFDLGPQRCIRYDPKNKNHLKAELSSAFRQVPPRYKFDEIKPKYV
jgi:hypothetical protein